MATTLATIHKKLKKEIVKEIIRRQKNLEKPLTANQILDTYFSLLQKEISKALIEENELVISGIFKIRVVKDEKAIRTYSKLSRKLKKKVRGI